MRELLEAVEFLLRANIGIQHSLTYPGEAQLHLLRIEQVLDALSAASLPPRPQQPEGVFGGLKVQAEMVGTGPIR